MLFKHTSRGFILFSSMGILRNISHLIWIFLLENWHISARYIENDGDALPCATPHREIAFPYISEPDGQFISSLDDYFNEYNLYQDDIFISFDWNNKTVTLILNKNTVDVENTHTEWTENNITYSEQTDDDCYYQGYVRNQRRSHLALSLCDGVSGYIKTDNQELIIRPKTHYNSVSVPLVHEVVACNDFQAPVLPSNDMATRHRRQAPSSHQKYLEVLIAADTSVVNLVGQKKVKQYIMTIMNIVNLIYKDATLGVNIEVVTSKLVLMEKGDEKRIITSGDARRTVDKFCRWVTEESYKGKYFSRDTKFDVAVFFTRTGIGPAGYAPITGLCNPTRSCAIVKDEGFTSAFIVAHEIAHVFGLMHDGHGNNCNGQEYQTAVMAAMVQATLNHFWWSSCSRERMKQVLPMLTCLNNNPVKTEKIKISQPLGTSWGLDEQCRYEFGSEHEACRTYHGDLCEMLWCNTRRNRRLCKTKRGRPLNGTRCGNDHWCMEGSCSYHGGQPPIDGGFNDWSQWSGCSDSCGFSLRSRTRKCENPRPAYGGKPCEGPYEEMDSCKSDACTQYADKREQQCTYLNVLPVRDRRNTWLPYQLDDENKHCKLTCISNETKEIATFDDIPVDDGTPCSYENPNHICVNGACWKLGCDGMRNSTKMFDDCGICGGNGSTCKTVEGRFTKKMKYNARGRNYEEVTVIPAGARNIEIKETVTSAHYIALLDPAYGTHLIGGSGRQSTTRKFAGNGAWFKYENRWNFEKLTSKGPLQRKLKLLIIPQNSVYKAALTYKYTVTNDDNTHEKELYEWRYKGWTDCSVTCGSGVQSLVYKCFAKSTGEETEEVNCRLLKDPTGEPVKCTRGECNADIYRWVMSVDWSDCTHTCGTDGIQHQLYSCERESQNGDEEAVDMEMCSSLETPDYTRACNRKPCRELEYRWVMSSEWSDCSVTCGEGLQSQTFSCGQDTSNGAIEVVEINLCNHLETPNVTRECILEECENYQWVLTDDFSPCSETCGENGVETQMFFCGKVNSYDDVSSTGFDMCFGIDVPNITRPCNRVPCITYQWTITDNWDTCTASCGSNGVQHLIYKCVAEQSNQPSKDVDSELCSNSNQPNSTRQCNRVPCFQYKIIPSLNWTECSTRCGDTGVQHQIISCVNETLNGKVENVDMKHCSNLETQIESRSCNRVPCFQYEVVPSLNWTQCSHTCGDSGIQQQIYNCIKENINDDSEIVDMSNCSGLDMPIVTKNCNRIPCLHYKIIPSVNWTDCSSSCGNSGIQQLIYKCIRQTSNGDSETVDMSYCTSLDLPLVTRMCNRTPCETFKWIPTDEWTPCTATCGNDGIQYSNHKCFVFTSNDENEPVSEEYCNDTEKQVIKRECNRVPCLLEWQAGGWSECSVTCGIGIQTRAVTCGDPNISADDHRCPGEPPSLSEICKRQDCPLRNDGCRDRISICSRSATPRKCRYRGYKTMCCGTCRNLHDIAPNDSWYK